MEVKTFYKLSLLALSAVLMGGCLANMPNASKEKVKSKVEKKVQKIAKKVEPPKPKEIHISELKPNGLTNLALKGKRIYSVNEPIQFSIDTKGKSGYLYIVYEDSKGKVGVLYPNPNSPLSQMSGKYIFPKDFGLNPQAVVATKDCKGCEKDKTIIYAFLVDKPIVDIQTINKTTLHNILGIGSPKKSGAQSKGLSVDFYAGMNSGNNGNVDVGVFELYVK